MSTESPTLPANKKQKTSASASARLRLSMSQTVQEMSQQKMEDKLSQLSVNNENDGKSEENNDNNVENRAETPMPNLFEINEIDRSSRMFSFKQCIFLVKNTQCLIYE